MKVSCKISGITFFSSPHFKEEPVVEDYHPIFSLPPRVLLAKAKKYGEGRYSPEEEKLLFLALLNATGAVIWECPATPEATTVKKHMEGVFQHLGWYERIASEGLQLPKIRVTPYNPTLSNIGIYLLAWYDVRKEWMSPTSRRQQEELLEKRAFLLHKLIHSPGRNEGKKIKLLASWALDAANVEGEDKRREWMELFTLTPETGLFSCDLDELRDLQEHMQRELYAVGSIGAGIGSEQSGEVLRHLHYLVKTRENGLVGFLGGPNRNSLSSPLWSLKSDKSEEEQLEEIEKEESSLENELATYSAILGSGNTETQPSKASFGNRLSDWMKANAAWRRVSSLKEELEFLRANKRKRESGSLVR